VVAVEADVELDIVDWEEGVVGREDCFIAERRWSVLELVDVSPLWIDIM
jgi:hypothetical protein